MSEFTFAVMVKTTLEKALTVVKNFNTNAYLFRANNLWTAVTMEDYSKGVDLAKRISSELNTHAFNFINCEDHGWEYSLYFDGNQLANLVIDYEKDNPENPAGILKNADLELLKALGGKESALEDLKNYILNYTPENILNGVDYFKNAFNFENISWVSYSYLGQLTEQEKISLGLIFIEPKPSLKETILHKLGFASEKGRKLNLKKLILNSLGEKLAEKGYFFEKNNPLAGDYAFFRMENSFRVGLQIFKTENTLSAGLKTHTGDYDLFYITGQKPGFRTYSNEPELKEIMDEILTQFLDKGESIIREESLDQFDALATYENIVDPFLEQYNFKRNQAEDIVLAGGSVIYKNGAKEIKFQHGQHYVAIGCYVKTDNGEKNLLELVPEIPNQGGFPFNNVTDYQQNIDKFIDFLKNYYLMME